MPNHASLPVLMWNNQNAIDVTFIIIKQLFIEIYIHDWYSSIKSSSRLSHYCLFKHDFQMNHYLKCNIETKYQLIMAKFRLYAHNLKPKGIVTQRETNEHAHNVI